MSRPCKRRRICGLPACGHFGPKDGEAVIQQSVSMTLDEFESIRLIDLDGLTQEQCASQMNIARTTVQVIYASARKKLAECLVNRKELCIEGGEYIICDGTTGRCGCSSHCKKFSTKKNQSEDKWKGETNHENCSNI